MFRVSDLQFEISESTEPGKGFEIHTYVDYETLIGASDFSSLPKHDLPTVLNFINSTKVEFKDRKLSFPPTVFTEAFEIQFSKKKLDSGERLEVLEKELARLRMLTAALADNAYGRLELWFDEKDGLYLDIDKYRKSVMFNETNLKCFLEIALYEYNRHGRQFKDLRHKSIIEAMEDVERNSFLAGNGDSRRYFVRPYHPKFKFVNAIKHVSDYYFGGNAVYHHPTINSDDILQSDSHSCQFLVAGSRHLYRTILNQLGSKSIMIGWYNIPYKTHIWKYMKTTNPEYSKYRTKIIEQFVDGDTPRLHSSSCPMYYEDVFIHPEF